VGADFADTVGWDGDLVDLLFGERLSTVVGVVEFATGRWWLASGSEVKGNG
jgi:hypothetical protein